MKNSAIKINNPHYFPRTKAGRPGEGKYKRLPEQVFSFGKGRPREPKYWKADLFNASDALIDSIIGQGTQQSAFAEAQSMVGKSYKGNKIKRVVLDGPFDTIDDIPVNDEDLPEPKSYEPDEIEVMELAATAPRAPRGTVKIIPPSTISETITKKKPGRPKKLSTHTYKIGDIVRTNTTQHKHIAIIKDLIGKSHGYTIYYYDNGTVHPINTHEDYIEPLPKGRPSAYTKSIIDILKKTLAAGK